MALRLRRGTDAERLLITPLEGELIYTTDTKLLYVGDGTTVGGTLVTGSGGSGSATLDGLTDTNIAGVLDNQVLTYDSATSKWIPTTIPNVGQLNLGDLGDVIVADAEFKDVIAFDGVRWTTIRAQDAINPGSNLSVNIVGDDSTVMVNTTTGTFTGDLFGDVVGDVTGNVTGDIRGVIIGLAGSNIIGDTNGAHFGDVTGGTISGVINGLAGSNIIGNLTGNVTGNVTGDVNGSLNGNVIGSVQGDVQGSVFGDDSSIIIDAINNKITTGTLEIDGNNPGFAGALSSISSTIISNSLTKKVGVNARLALYGIKGGMDVYSNSDTADEVSVFSAFTSSNIEAPTIEFYRTRGTLENELPLQDQDNLMLLAWGGADSDTQLSIAAAIGATVDGTPTSGIVPGKLSFLLTNGAGDFAPAFEITNNGLVVADNTVVAGAGSGEVDDSAVVDYLKITVGGTELALPLYAIRP